MRRKIEWFLVANAEHARVLASDHGKPLSTVRGFEHPASRSKTSELGTDKGGREVSGHGFGGAAFEPRSDPHRREHEKFAHELGQFLEHEAILGTFDSVSIFAPDPFFGKLRGQLGKNTGKRLAAARAVDFSAVPAEELGARIRQALGA